MRLITLTLRNFRNFADFTAEFQYPVTMILGPNARGKTNVLEAVYVAVHGYGFRESREEELLRIDEDTGFVEAVFNEKEAKTKLSIYFQRTDTGVNKKTLVNNVQRTAYQYQQSGVHTILFSPDQLQMIIGAPSERRQYFDRLISYYDGAYKSKLINYENGLRKRNKVLERYTNPTQLKEELEFWNNYLEEQGSYLTQKREEYVRFLQTHPHIDSAEFTIEYLKSELTRETLEQSHEEEKRLRKTIIGPQRDDFQISKIKTDNQKYSVHHFGSRSEQRLALFWLHWSEVKYYEALTKKKPILLLDDIFSELDVSNKKLISHMVSNYQTILTTTDKELQGYLQVPESAIILL